MGKGRGERPGGRGLRLFAERGDVMELVDKPQGFRVWKPRLARGVPPPSIHVMGLLQAAARTRTLTVSKLVPVGLQRCGSWPHPLGS